MRTQIDKTTNTQCQFFSLVEIGMVILSAVVVSFAMKTADINIFALPHLVFLFVALLFRSVVAKWKLSDWGIGGNIHQQVKMGILMWLVVQSYYSSLHLFAPLFPVSARIGATVFKVTTLNGLRDTILFITLFKAGILETFRYFAYAEGLLMQAFGAPLGAIMTFAYFGSAHMGIMNLIVLPVSFLFVYFYRTYRLVIPVIIFHALGDTGGFIQNYFSFHGMYVYNYVIFFLLLAVLFLFRSDIKETMNSIIKMFMHDIYLLRDHKIKALSLSIVLPLWLHFLLYVENHV